jgi:Zn-dependent protease with chaperone function
MTNHTGYAGPSTGQSGRRIFPDLDAEAFQHPLDREATRQLRQLVGFDTVVAKFLELRYERLLYVINVASSVKVGPRQFPRLYDMLRESCSILDVPEPELYVSQSPQVNAFTFGHTSPHIVLFSGLVDLMNDEEIRGTIAHEVGHIKCGHVLYYSMATALRDISAIISELTLGLGGIVLIGFEAALINWRRRSELSADRAQLLVAQDLNTCLGTLAKLAGGSARLADQLNPAEFLEQAKLYDQEMDKGVVERLYRIWADLYQGTHPFVVERAKELSTWANSPDYAGILAGNYLRRSQNPGDPANGPKTVRIKVNSGN